MNNEQPKQAGDFRWGVNFFILICQIVALLFSPILRRPSTTGRRLFRTIHFWIGFCALAVGTASVKDPGLIGLVLAVALMTSLHYARSTAARIRGDIINSMACGVSWLAGRFSNKTAICVLEPFVLIFFGYCFIQPNGDYPLGAVLIVGGICSIVSGAVLARAANAEKRAIDDARADSLWQAEFVRKG
jgi:hypothetical protein